MPCLKAQRGYKRAIVAVAHKILVATYHMLSHQVCYSELGDLYLDKLNRHTLTRNLVHRLERLGYSVTAEGRVKSVPVAHTGSQLSPIFIAGLIREELSSRVTCTAIFMLWK